MAHTMACGLGLAVLLWACSDGTNGGAASTTGSTLSSSSASSGGTGMGGAAGASAWGGGPSSSSAATGGAASTYDAAVLADHPVAFWLMSHAAVNEPDHTGNGHTGTYQGAPPTAASMPNGDTGAGFDGASGYLTVPSSTAFSIPTTGNLTWEAWIRPDVLQFPNDETSGYVDWMGKCEQYSPTCEWEARMYDTMTNESPNRPNRLSAYVFNPSAGLGSAADWQPAAGLIQAGGWYHVVG